LEVPSPSAPYGAIDPRNLAGSATYPNYNLGWVATALDRSLVWNLAFDPEMKGLVFDCDASLTSQAPPAGFSLSTSTVNNTTTHAHDQGGGSFGPYIWLIATLAGDVNDDGAVNVQDLILLATAFGSTQAAGPHYNIEADFNCDGRIDVSDLLKMAFNYGHSL
jgi:hypothetical protein